MRDWFQELCNKALTTSGGSTKARTILACGGSYLKTIKLSGGLLINQQHILAINEGGEVGEALACRSFSYAPPPLLRSMGQAGAKL